MFHDIEKTARTLVVWLFAYVAACTVSITAYVYAIAHPEVIRVGEDFGPVDWITFTMGVLVFLPTVFLTLRWIYRANANAQQLTSEMSIAPGWNVGWFFVPVANLWKPFTGVRETWAVSRDPQGWASISTPIILRVWWAFWLCTIILDNTLLRQTWNTSSVDDVVRYLPLEIAAAMAWFATTLLLIRVVRALSHAQAQTIMRHTFA